MSHTVTIQEIHYINHDVVHIRTDKPNKYNFKPGQATEVALDKDDWREEKRPFTFTSLPDDNFLEFTIKVYPEHDGVTQQIGTLNNGDHLLIEDAWGAIEYQGSGVFIAGGAGITPFISIFKHLENYGSASDNTLLFANKRKRDIIFPGKFESLLGDRFINILSEEEHPQYAHGHMDKAFIDKHISDWNRRFYVCGPPPMMDAVLADLQTLGVHSDLIIIEDLD
ncbi:FAD-binding oxidoreductase [Croceiramulus getboli]|nr:FAD-binding oxidoreductase [Flavobacteriaceae bacterium YJPT1-3]